MAGAGEYTISDWPDELFTVSRTTVRLRRRRRQLA